MPIESATKIDGQAFAVVGTRPRRDDAADKVTGKAVFGADVRLPGMLQGKVLRSPHAHARILWIDTSKAEALPGVYAVITARDIWGADLEAARPGRARPDLKFFRDRFLASDKVYYRGHPVAAVAAVDQYVAEEALELIDVQYEVLPPVIDVVEAMREDAPLLHEDLFTDSLGQPVTRPSNVATHFQHLVGDPEAGFAEADVVVEREFRTSTVHQGYIEPMVAAARCDANGDFTLWIDAQGSFPQREEVARLLQHPISKIRVVPCEIGGGFGGKQRTYLEPLVALLARKAGGHPVRIQMSRSEVFQGSGPAPGSFMRVKIGAKRDGKITAAVVDLMFEAGGFPGSSVGGAARCALNRYHLPNVRIDGYDVVVNKPKSDAYRAPGATQSTYAVESVIDELSEKLGLDPLEMRLRNAAKEGTRRTDGPVFKRIGVEETLRAAMDHPHYRSPLGGPNRGRGIACGWWGNGAGLSSYSIAVNTDGSVNVSTGSVDLSGTRISLAMQAAEALEIDIDRVHPAVADTDSMGFTGNSGGSRTTFATGIVAIEAAHEVLRQMKQRAAILWGVEPDTVYYSNGVFYTSSDASLQLSFCEVAAKQNETGGPIYVSNSKAVQDPGSAFAVHIVDVEVDPETGKVRVLRYTVVQDVGKAVHPSAVEGQIQGAVGQGTGWALWEGYNFDQEGRMRNATLLDYKLPTCLDLPMIEAQLVEVPNPTHPFGVRGVAEVPLVAGPAALANAIHAATGARMRRLPMTPGRILQQMGVIE